MCVGGGGLGPPIQRLPASHGLLVLCECGSLTSSKPSMGLGDGGEQAVTCFELLGRPVHGGVRGQERMTGHWCTSGSVGPIISTDSCGCGCC